MAATARCRIEETILGRSLNRIHQFEHMPDVHIPDFIPYVLALSGLLLLWEFHALPVRSGRSHGVDFLHRSGIRMVIYAAPHDNSARPACREAHRHVFL